MSLLKLLALDEEDLEIVSAHLQDAVVKVRDLNWHPHEKRFIALLNRFAWEEVMKGGFLKRQHNQERHRAALRFDRVLSVSVKGIDRNKPDDVLSLLTIQFQPKQMPYGTIILLFSGEAAIRLEVECIESQLTDLGPVWEAQNRPQHR